MKQKSGKLVGPILFAFIIPRRTIFDIGLDQFKEALCLGQAWVGKGALQNSNKKPSYFSSPPTGRKPKKRDSFRTQKEGYRGPFGGEKEGPF